MENYFILITGAVVLVICIAVVARRYLRSFDRMILVYRANDYAREANINVDSAYLEALINLRHWLVEHSIQDIEAMINAEAGLAALDLRETKFLPEIRCIAFSELLKLKCSAKSIEGTLSKKEVVFYSAVCDDKSKEKDAE